MAREAGIHFELYRHLQNALDKCSEYHGVRFGRVIPEKKVGSGRADIVVEDDRGRPLVVIEAKRESTEGYDRNLDPYSPRVIEQAFGYAGALGAEYFATYNGSLLVLYRTFEKGVPLLNRKSRAYRVTDPKLFAGEFLQQIAAIKKGRLGWEPDPKAFVNRLRVFHQRLASEMLAFIRTPDPKFEKIYSPWAKKQGWDVNEPGTSIRFSKQAAYLLMNKLLFYKILEDTGHSVPRLTLHDLVDPAKRREGFRRITEKVDFEAVYSHDAVFDGVPLSKRASLEVEEFLEELETYDLDRFQYDTIGHIYEDIIPPQERHDLGQYYTPPEIVELITKMTVKSYDDRVLDPACGSGGFLIRAYNHLKELKQRRRWSFTHEEILSQLHGFDINRFPAHLSAINLALQDLKTETRVVNLVVEDFFNIHPGQERLFTERASVTKPAQSRLYESVSTGKAEMDVIIANPPYIRQEKIKDKKKCREHLKSMGYSDLSERSDIYVYFFTHSMEFLRDKGRMGFITPDKWLTVGYGEGLQRFLLDNFKILSIISFERRVFDDPLVPTCVTILERCPLDLERGSNVTKFMRIKEEMKIDQVVSFLKDEVEAGSLIDEKQYRLITVTQSELATTKKWNRFLHAPTLYWDILGHEKICQLKDVARVTRGKTTGANGFFYLRNDDVKSWGIDSEFLRPLVKSIRQVDTLEFKREQTDIYVLDLHDYIEQALSGNKADMMEGVSLDSSTLPADADEMELSREEIYILSEMWKNGHKGLYNYIIHSMWGKDWGSQSPPHKTPTCTQRRSRNGCWFDLGRLQMPPLLLSRFYWEYRRPVSVLNSETTPDCQMYLLETKNDVLPTVLCASLNSSLGVLFRELHGRTTGGGMNWLTVYEAKELPVVDPRKLSKEEAKRVEKVMSSIIGESGTANLDLDRAILAALGLEDHAEEISAYAQSLYDARRGSKEVGVMIAGIDGKRTKVKRIKGAELISHSEQAKLTDF